MKYPSLPLPGNIPEEGFFVSQQNSSLFLFPPLKYYKNVADWKVFC